MDKIKLPEGVTLHYPTLAFLNHMIAGRTANIKGCAKFLAEGKTKLSSGEDIAELILRDDNQIIEVIKNLKEQASE